MFDAGDGGIDRAVNLLQAGASRPGNGDGVDDDFADAGAVVIHDPGG